MRGNDLPISVNRAAVFSATSPGTGWRPAASASSPKPACLPDACDSTPAATVISEAGTPQACAAAPTSMARADAPAWRIGSHRSLMLDDPPVIRMPNSRIDLAVIQPASCLTALSLSG